MRCVVLIIGTAIFLPIQANAGDANDWTGNFDRPPKERRQNRLQLAVGIEVRSDEKTRIDAPEIPRLTALYFPFDFFAFKLSASFTPSSVLDDDLHFAATNYEIGLRLQTHEGVVSPFFETGLAFNRYYSTGGNDFLDKRSGLMLALGFSLRLGSKGYLDFTLHHIANYIALDYAIAQPYGTLPNRDESQAPCFFSYFGYNSCLSIGNPRTALYNPTTIGLQYRFGL